MSERGVLFGGGDHPGNLWDRGDEEASDDADACLGMLQERGALPGDVMAVLSVGSHALGWANSRSDRDFYIVTSSPWPGPRSAVLSVPLRPRAVPVQVLGVDGEVWEIKYWIDLQVVQMLAKITWDRFEKGSSVGRDLAEAEEIFLETLLTCRPVAGGSWLRHRRADLAATAFRAMVITRSLSEADACVADALGQLDADDACSAVLSARNAFGHAVDALLESLGHHGSRNVKWRARRFREAAPAQLTFEEYWALETMAGLKPADPAQWVTDVIRLCKDLTLEVEA
jgi:hypothetical protein